MKGERERELDSRSRTMGLDSMKDRVAVGRRSNAELLGARTVNGP